MRLEEILAVGAEKGLDREAVRFQGRALTYGQLVAMSDEFASLLISAGIRPCDRVILLLRKSLEAIIAIFGVLKAQATYIPVHTADPPYRLGQVVEESCPHAVITHPTWRGLTKRYLEKSGVNLLVELEVSPLGKCNAVVERLGARPHADWSIPPSSEQPAYILYSSGSTGRPKGIVHSHASSLAFVKWACEEFSTRESDRVGNCASLAFDLSVLDVFCTLWRGGCLVLVPEAAVLNPRLLVDIWVEEKITVWYSTPTVLELILTYGKLSRYRGFHMRLILFAGEIFAVPRFLQLQEAFPGVEKYNLYGPTETNVCTFYRATESTSPNLRAIPIGWPCPETRVQVVMQDDSTDESGELWVCGPTVMLGYLDELLAGKVASVRIDDGHRYREYQTGDMVYQDENGCLHFLGRKDAMLKIRGYRIFPSEIENSLLTHSQVAEVVVVPREMPDGKVGLVACVVAAEGSSPSEDTLRKHCEQQIPVYMIPSRFWFVDELPKTATQKADRLQVIDLVRRKGKKHEDKR